MILGNNVVNFNVATNSILPSSNHQSLAWNLPSCSTKKKVPDGCNLGPTRLVILTGWVLGLRHHTPRFFHFGQCIYDIYIYICMCNISYYIKLYWVEFILIYLYIFRCLLCVYIQLYVYFSLKRTWSRCTQNRYPFSASFFPGKKCYQGNRAAVPSSWRICRYVGKPQRMVYPGPPISTEPWWVRRKFVCTVPVGS